MWSLFNKKQTPQPVQNEQARVQQEKTVQKFEFLEDIQPYIDQLPNLEAELTHRLRFWVPTLVNECIEKDFRDNIHCYLSRADLLREVFLIHCYGKTAVQIMRKNALKPPKLADDAEYPLLNNIRLSTRQISLGKNICPIIVPCHQKHKEDLKRLVQAKNTSLSYYLRKLVSQHYLGYGFSAQIALQEDEKKNLSIFLRRDAVVEKD